MSGPIVLNVRINADGSVAVANMRQVEDAETRVGAAGKRAGDEVSSGFSRANESVASFRSIIQESQRTLLSLAGLHFGAEFVRDVVDANNKVQSWRFGLQAATSDQRKAAESLAFIRAESGRLGLELEDNGSTWTRLAAAVKGTRLEGEGAQKIFTATAEAARTLHLSGAETNQMLTALDQMMSKGTVQAQELKLQLGNVLPGAMHIAADSIGVTTAQLDKMMDRGEIVAEDFLPKFAKRLHELYGATATEAANSPAAQIARLKNAVFELKAAVGDAGFMATLGAHAASLTSTLTKLVQSGALDIIVRGLLAIGQVSATTFLVTKVIEWATAQVKAAQASAAATAAQKAQAVASAEAAQARVAELRGTLSVIEAARAEEVAKLAVARADVVMAERHLAAAQAAGTQSLALREVARAEEALTAARVRQTAITTELAALGRAQAGVQTQLAASTIAADAAQARLVATSGLLGKAWTGLKSAGATLFGLLGGWIGVAVGAAYGLYTAYDYLTTKSERHEQALKAEVAQIEAVTVSLRAYHQEIANGDGLGNLEKETKAYVDSVALLTQKETELTAKKAQLRAAEEDLRVATELSKRGIDETGAGIVIASGRVERLRAEIQPTAKAVDELRNVVRLVGGDLGNVVPFVNDLTSSFQQLREASTLGGVFTASAKTIQNFFATAKALAADKEAKTIFDDLIAQGKKAEVETEKVRLGVVGYAKAQQERMLADLAARGASQQLIDMRKRESDQAIKNISADEAAKEAKKHHKDATKELEREIEQYNAAQIRAAEYLTRLQGAVNPVIGAYMKYKVEMIDLGKMEADLIDKSRKLGKEEEGRAEAVELHRRGQAAALETLQKTLDVLGKQVDVLGQLRKEYSDQTSLIGLTERERAIADAVHKATDEWQKNEAAHLRNKQTLGEVRQGAADLAAQMYDQTEAVKLNREAAQEWAGVWQQAGGGVSRLFADVLVRGGSLFKGLRDLAKDTVAQIIEYFTRLIVINPILNSVLGISLSGGLLPSIANAFTGGAAGAVTPLAQTGASVASAASEGAAGGGFDWTSGASWINWGKKLWDGFKGGFSSLFSSNSMNYLTARSGFLGSWSGFDPTGPGTGGTFTPSTFANITSILGGIYAGVNRFNSADGAFGKIGGGLAYGYGTYALGVGASAAITSGSLTAGLGAVSALGPVAWAAIAAIVVDKIFGGKLFGTSYRPESSTSSVSIGASGGEADLQLKEVKEQSFFRGRKWRTSDLDPGDDARKAAQEFFDQIKKVMTNGARALGVDVVPVIDAAIRTVSEYDKKGKVTATKIFVDVLGRTWEEATSELASMRVSAEAIIAQAGASAKDASVIAERWRKSAKDLYDGAQLILAAQTDINRRQSLLGEGAGSLKDVVDVVEQLRQGDETLVDAYARLQTETQALRASLALTGADIGKTGKAFVEFADAAAQAAGGADKLAQLTQQFATAFYNPQELAKAQSEAARKQAGAAIAALGLDANITREEFRKLYEAALPKMTPEQMVQWQQTGILLAAAEDAQKAYNDALKANAIGIQQILDQLDPERANRYAGSWQETLDGINKAFDDGVAKMKELGATVEQRAQAEAGRQKAIDAAAKQAQDTYDAIVKQIRDGMRALTQPSNELDAALQAVDDALTATRKQLEDAARKVPGMSGPNQADLDAANQYADEQKRQIKQHYADLVLNILDSLNPDKASDDSFGAKLKATNQQFDDAIAKLRAYGATADQIAQAQVDRQRVIGQQSQDFLRGLGIIGGGLTEYGQALHNLDQQYEQAKIAADALAVSQGRAGASAAELARIEAWAAQQRDRIAAQQAAHMQDLISQLYGGAAGTLDEVNRQIAELERSTSGLGASAGSAAASIDSATQALRDQVRLQIGDLSPYNDNQKLDIAKQAYMQGNASAEDVLNIARRLYASSNSYKQVFDWVEANRRAVSQPGTDGGGGGSGVDSARLAELYKQRDKLMADQLAEQRKKLTADLVQNIGERAEREHIDALRLMDLIGVKLVDVVKDLGINLKDIGANDVLALGNLATTLRVNLADIVAKLGLKLTDLYGGLKELTDHMGIDLARIDATSLQSLAGLAAMLNLNLRDLMTALHLDLGDISLGVEQMVQKLGIDLTNLNGTSVTALGKLAGDLRLSLSDVVAALHLTMGDLSAGLRELAAKQGIDLQAIDANGVKALAAMATSLNMSLSSLLDGMKLTLKDVAPGLQSLVSALGINLKDLNATNVTALGKLSGQLNTDLGSLVTALGLSLKDIAPGLTKIATDMGVNLSALSQADVAKLGTLADTLHIKLSDLASVLGIKLDGVSGALNTNTARIGVSVDALVAARIAGDRDLGVRFDGLNRSVTDMRSDQVAVLRSVDSGISRLPDVIRNSGGSGNTDVVNKLQGVIDTTRISLDTVFRQLVQISNSTSDTATNTNRTADSSAQTAVNTLRVADNTRNTRTAVP